MRLGAKALGFLLISPVFALAQPEAERLELVHADQLVGERVASGTLRRLDGNVLFRQGDAWMRCDRAVQFVEEGRVVFLGDVQFSRGDLLLRADRVTYLAGSREEWAEGRVLVEDSVRFLRAEKLHYQEIPEIARASGEVELRHRRTRAVLRADTVVYHRVSGLAEGWGHPRLAQEDSAGRTVFVLTGRRVRWFEDSRIFEAIGEVRIEQGSSWATCDTLRYFRSSETAVLRGQPSTWRRWEKVTGQEMEWRFVGDSLRQVHVWGRARVTSEADTLAPGTRRNHVEGDTIAVFFAEGEPRRVEVRGRATGLYYVFERSEPKGANWVLGDEIVLWVRGGRVQSMEVRGVPEAAEGRYYPERIVRFAQTEMTPGRKPLPIQE
ncbi:MAG: hypothetical protein ONB23_04265 [candidate division KSB1 bacterium]|nr:hypothetical protein [candidate division KSB1 bacterium]